VPHAERSLAFRDMTEADLEAGLGLSRASGWNQTLEDWRLLLRLGPGLFRVATDGGRVVAAGGAAVHRDALAWICMILVDPERRGRGLGTRIFDEVLERVSERVQAGGIAAVGLDATPAGIGIYAARGFERDADFVRLSAPPGTVGAGAPAAEPLAPDALGPVLALDRRVFGADRGPLLRRIASLAPDLARVVREGERVRGFCLGRHGDHSDHVGPVVAEDSAVARDLVTACRARPRDRSLVVDARPDPAFRDALAGLGFVPQRPLFRMYLGTARPPGVPALEPAVLGPEFG
jgi:GNAT superfamily N-acetyltransferase